MMATTQSDINIKVIKIRSAD